MGCRVRPGAPSTPRARTSLVGFLQAAASAPMLAAITTSCPAATPGQWHPPAATSHTRTSKFLSSRTCIHIAAGLLSLVCSTTVGSLCQKNGSIVPDIVLVETPTIGVLEGLDHPAAERCAVGILGEVELRDTCLGGGYFALGTLGSDFDCLLYTSPSPRDS